MKRETLEKRYYRITELVEMGIPRHLLIQYIKSPSAREFAVRNGKKGMWMIDWPVLKEKLSAGDLEA